VSARGRTVVLIASGAVLSASAAIWAAQGDQTRRIASFLTLFGIAAVAYLVALWASRGLSSRALAAALVLAAVWRIGLVPGPPMLSDDIYRYVWEGRIQLHEGNPYAWADRPEAEKWKDLRDDAWRRTTFKHLTAIYPPLWQLAARLTVRLHDSVAALKGLVVLCELALWLVLLALLARRGRPRERVLVIAWSPLALVELAGSGHNDALGMLLAAAALLALESHRPGLSAVMSALGAEAKLLPGLLAASWLRRYRAWHLATAAAVAFVVASPYLAEPQGLVRSLTAYSASWRFNHSLFALFALVFSRRSAALVAAAATLAVALALAWKRVDPARSALVVTATWLALAPNVLPWYALWLLPWLVLVEAPAGLAFTLTVALAYVVYPGWLAGGRWQVGWGIRALEYGPCLGLLLWQLHSARRRVAREAA
jgi:hypothetical protein